jgi:hypothetical protein
LGGPPFINQRTRFHEQHPLDKNGRRFETGSVN